MKNIFKFILIICLILSMMLILVNCNVEDGNVSPETTGPDSVPQGKVFVDNIYFRKGESIDGEIVLTSEHIKNVTVGFNFLNSYVLNFTLTDEGTPLLYECSVELSQTGGKLSIWVGDEKYYVILTFDGITKTILKIDVDHYNPIIYIPIPIAKPF